MQVSPRSRRHAAQIKALARHRQWRTALRLFGRMRSSAARRGGYSLGHTLHRSSAGREPAAAKRPGLQAQASGLWEGRDAHVWGRARGSQLQGPLGSDADPDNVSYTLAAAICARNQLWQQARAPPCHTPMTALPCTRHLSRVASLLAAAVCTRDQAQQVHASSVRACVSCRRLGPTRLVTSGGAAQVLDLHREVEAVGLRPTPRMLTLVLDAAEQLSMWRVADQVRQVWPVGQPSVHAAKPPGWPANTFCRNDSVTGVTRAKCRRANDFKPCNAHGAC